MIIRGDCLVEMAGMDADSVDAVVTDPPYGIAFMGQSWDKPRTLRRGASQVAPCKDMPVGQRFTNASEDREYQAWCEQWARELFRVMKPGAYLAAFGATRLFHRLACGIQDAGFEPRDAFAWVRGAGFPKSRNTDDGRGTALKPAWEPITLSQKPREGTYEANDAKWGCGYLNVDDARVPLPEGDSVGYRPVIDSNSRSVFGFGGVSRNGTDTLGRWPANVVHDGSDEVLAEFPRTVNPFGKDGVMHPSPNGRSPMFGVDKRESGLRIGDAGNAARYFYCAKPSTREREMGLPGRCAHPTLKPIALMQWLIRLVTPRDGLVLDPFLGSGTTAIAAHLEGRRCVGVEREAEYADIAEKRLEWWRRNGRPGQSVTAVLGETPVKRKDVATADLFG